MRTAANRRVRNSQFGPNRPSEPRHSLGKPIGILDTEAQPQPVPGPDSVDTDVTEVTGNIHHLFLLDGSIEQRTPKPRVHMFGHGHPDVDFFEKSYILTNENNSKNKIKITKLL